ncbi:hypothetical protein COLO4_18663 [Corchorus olitorius]|uniref:Protein kinase domain-containing protein n=1 Tax=Corchorus olitorius TaxID=93759 RepID=A0A1R3J887_9ROSI|nr:hypothetical protein COLO4_18663 [Corchorus olitorius]
MGLGRKANQVYIIDFGLAKKDIVIPCKSVRAKPFSSTSSS